MAFRAARTQLADRPDRKLSEIIGLLLAEVLEALGDIHADATNFGLFERADALVEVGEGDTSREDRASTRLDKEVSHTLASDLVQQLHAPQAVIDEDITCHQLVYEELLDQRHRALMGKVRLRRLLHSDFGHLRLPLVLLRLQVDYFGADGVLVGELLLAAAHFFCDLVTVEVGEGEAGQAERLGEGGVAEGDLLDCVCYHE